MKTFTASSLLLAINLFTHGLATPTNLAETRALAERQSTPETAEVIVCNKYEDRICGSSGDCHSITLVTGTMASTPGTACWYLPGIPHPPPRSVQNIMFCNKAAGKGTCHLSQDCTLNEDGSCSAKGTESMGLSG